MARSLILSGAQVGLYVNGVLFGRVASFSYDSGTPRRRIGGVDTVSAVELAPTVSNISGTLGVYRLSQDGAAEGAGMVAPISELSREKYFSLLLIDFTSNAVIFSAAQCAVESQSWSFEARQLVRGTVSFSALTYQNEIRPIG